MEEQEKASKIRGENWTIVLYTENEEDMKILEYIKKNYKYAYIVHDSDFETDEETGEIKQKKEHIHVIFIFENAREIGAIAKELNIERLTRIEKVKSIRYMFRYLLHLDQPTKTKYEKDQIKSNCNELITKYCKEDKEPQDIEKLYEYIYTIDRHIYIHEVLEYALRNNLYSSFRRGTNLMLRIIEEHNKLFLERKESEKAKALFDVKAEERELKAWEYAKKHTRNNQNN